MGLVRLAVHRIEGLRELGHRALVDAHDEVVEIDEDHVERADRVTDAARDLAHRERGRAVRIDDVGRG